jgi:hypothetical protein
VLAALARSGAPVVVVVADSEGVSELQRTHVVPLHLDDLQSDRVREFLSSIRARLQPPLDDAELEEYARSVTTGLQLESLLRLLWLTRNDGAEA